MGDGYAPAHIAIDNDDVECLKICLRWGADSEVRNFKSETPQQLAYLFNNKDPNCEMVSGSIMSFSKWVVVMLVAWLPRRASAWVLTANKRL